MEWEVGQVVYIVSGNGRRRQGSEATITKINRKWVEVEPIYLGKFSKEDGSLQAPRGYTSDGKAWPSKKAYEDDKRLKEKWAALRQHITYQKPDHLSEFDLDLISGLLSNPS